MAEALMLLSAPALVVTLSVQIWLFTRRGVFRSGRTMRAAIALASTIVTVPIVTLVLWMMMASLFTPPANSVGPASFIPGFIACLIVGIPLTWWGIAESGKRD